MVKNVVYLRVLSITVKKRDISLSMLNIMIIQCGYYYMIHELVLMKYVNYDTVLNQEERDAVILDSSTGYIFLTDVSSTKYGHLSLCSISVIYTFVDVESG